MSFVYPRGAQALLLAPTALQLGVIEATSGGTHRFIADATFATTVEHKEVKLGYPSRTVKALPSRYGATATLTTRDMVSAKALLTTIADSTVAAFPPTSTLSLKTHSPEGTGMTLALANAILLQQFSISGSQDDFHSIQFSYEATNPTMSEAEPTWADFITIGALGSSGAFLPTDSPEVLGLGMPRVTVGGVSVGAIKGFTLSLSTEYKRHESGFPAVLSRLFSLSHSLTLSVDMEEFDGAFSMPSGTEQACTVIFGYGVGIAGSSFTISFTGVVNGASGKLAPGDFSSADLSITGVVSGANKLFTVT